MVAKGYDSVFVNHEALAAGFLVAVRLRGNARPAARIAVQSIRLGHYGEELVFTGENGDSASKLCGSGCFWSFLDSADDDESSLLPGSIHVGFVLVGTLQLGNALRKKRRPTSHNSRSQGQGQLQRLSEKSMVLRGSAEAQKLSLSADYNPVDQRGFSHCGWKLFVGHASAKDS